MLLASSLLILVLIQTGCLVTNKGDSMKKASVSFLVLCFATLMTTFQSYAQISYDSRDNRDNRGGRHHRDVGDSHDYEDYRESNIITERVYQNVRMRERLKLSDLLRLSYEQQRNIEILSLSLSARALYGQSQITLFQNGLHLASESLKGPLREVRFDLIRPISINALDISVSQDILLDTITAEVSVRGIPSPRPDPRDQQPTPYSALTLQVNQNVRGMDELQLRQMVRQQLGLTLEGVEIDRVVVIGQSLGYARVASVQVELNNHLVGIERYLSSAQSRIPLEVQSYEEVRTLKLIVRGDAYINTVMIFVGQVRASRPEFPNTQRIYIGQEISGQKTLELSRYLPYEQRLIRSLSIEARATRQSVAQLNLMSIFGQLIGSATVTQIPMFPTIQLYRPMAAHELRLQSFAPALIGSIEVEFEPNYRY